MTPVAKQPTKRTQPNQQPLPRREVRTYPVKWRMAEEGESRRVEGYAAVFDSPSGDLGFREIIKPGAFDNALKNSDVRALFNHDPNFLLARTKSGTLKLEIDERGLRYSFDAPRTQAGDDLLEMLKRGDLAESSFAFSIDDTREGTETWERNKDTGKWKRTILEVEELFDVAPVTYPAYMDTTVAKRSLQRAQEKQAKNTSTYRRDLAARELSIL